MIARDWLGNASSSALAIAAAGLFVALCMGFGFFSKGGSDLSSQRLFDSWYLRGGFTPDVGDFGAAPSGQPGST